MGIADILWPRSTCCSQERADKNDYDEERPGKRQYTPDQPLGLARAAELRKLWSWKLRSGVVPSGHGPEPRCKRLHFLGQGEFRIRLQRHGAGGRPHEAVGIAQAVGALIEIGEHISGPRRLAV